MVTPDVSVGLELADTTSVVPPLDGVLNAYEVLPTVRPYHVVFVHDDAE